MGGDRLGQPRDPQRGQVVGLDRAVEVLPGHLDQALVGQAEVRQQRDGARRRSLDRELDVRQHEAGVALGHEQRTPLARRLDAQGTSDGIGARRLIGRTGVVLEDIAATGMGMVRVDREDWRAESAGTDAILAGTAYDQLGSYTTAFIALIILGLAGALAAFTCPHPGHPPKPDAATS